MLLRVTTSFRPSVLSGEIPGLGGDSGSVWRRLRRRYWRISFAGERRDSLVACKRAAKGCVWSVCVWGGYTPRCACDPRVWGIAAWQLACDRPHDFARMHSVTHALSRLGV